MKFTKKEETDIKWYFRLLQERMEVNKLFENKQVIPEFYKINLILYGKFTGRIIEIIKRRINYKDLDKNLNADEIIKEKFGENFFNWLCKDNKRFIYGRDYNSSNNNSIYNIDDIKPNKKQS